jgi:hypothetical protein
LACQLPSTLHMSNRFVFPLQKVLDWYRQILTVEKEQLQRILGEIRELDRLASSLERRRHEELEQIQGASLLLGRDLIMLSDYAALIRDELCRIRNVRIRKEARLIEQRQRVASSYRRVRSIERLEHRRREEWIRACSIEENSVASELFLSAMLRQASERSGDPSSGNPGGEIAGD